MEAWSCEGCGASPTITGDGVVHLVDGGRDEYDDDLFQLLTNFESESFWFRGRNRLITWALREYGREAESFLEVGCGTGFVLEGLRHSFPGMRLVGIELFAAAFPFALARVPDAEFVQADGRHLPFRDEFAAAGAFDVLEHVDEDEDVLVGLRDALRPDGLLLVTVPQHPWLWSAPDEVAEHRRRYTRADLAAKARRAGLVVERLTSFVSLLLPPMAASRLVRRRAGRTYDLSSEFQTAKHLNRVFEKVMDAELAAIKHGVSLPIGGSLLLIARKQ